MSSQKSFNDKFILARNLRGSLTATLLAAVAIVGITFNSCGNPKPKSANDRFGSRLELAHLHIALEEISAIGEVPDAPLNGYRLILRKKDPTCKSQSPGLDQVHSWHKGSLSRAITASCSWLVGLKLGSVSPASSQIQSATQDGGEAESITSEAMSLSKIYFETTGGGDESLKEISADELTPSGELTVKLRLNLTEAGWEAGYGRLLAGAATSGDVPSIQVPSSSDPSNPQSGWIDIGVGVDPSVGGYDPSYQIDSLQVSKASTKKGVDYPTTWSHDSHPLIVKYHGKSEARGSDFVDLWLAKELNPVFEKLYRSPYNVRSLSHIGIYNYRKISGTSSRSKHSYALAIDISTFVRSDGSKITLEDDWNSSAHRDFLRQVRDLFCQHFDIVLSPDYNSDHYNHFHIALDPKGRYREPSTPRWDDLPSSLALTAAELPSEIYREISGHSFAHGIASDADSGFSLAPGSTCR